MGTNFPPSVTHMTNPSLVYEIQGVSRAMSLS